MANKMCPVMLMILLQVVLCVSQRTEDYDDDDTRDRWPDDPFPRPRGRDRDDSGGGRGRDGCPRISSNQLRNGWVKVKGRGRIAKFNCDPGFTLVGSRFATCVRRQWTYPVPVCVFRGCGRPFQVDNSRLVVQHRGAVVQYECLPGYSRAGSTHMYCDGITWTPLEMTRPPSCEGSRSPNNFCTFEDGLCGWEEDPSSDFESQVYTELSTDNSYLGLLPSPETSRPRSNETCRLFSPVYPPSWSGGCFEFKYELHGPNIGYLRVYIKPETQAFFLLSPSLVRHSTDNDAWQDAKMDIPVLETKFQIVIESVRGSKSEGEIAVDNIYLHTNRCITDHNEYDNVTANYGDTTQSLTTMTTADVTTPHSEKPEISTNTPDNEANTTVFLSTIPFTSSTTEHSSLPTSISRKTTTIVPSTATATTVAIKSSTSALTSLLTSTTTAKATTASTTTRMTATSSTYPTTNTAISSTIPMTTAVTVNTKATTTTYTLSTPTSVTALTTRATIPPNTLGTSTIVIPLTSRTAVLINTGSTPTTTTPVPTTTTKVTAIRTSVAQTSTQTTSSTIPISTSSRGASSSSDDVKNLTVIPIQPVSQTITHTTTPRYNLRPRLRFQTRPYSSTTTTSTQTTTLRNYPITRNAFGPYRPTTYRPIRTSKWEYVTKPFSSTKSPLLSTMQSKTINPSNQGESIDFQSSRALSTEVRSEKPVITIVCVTVLLFICVAAAGLFFVRRREALKRSKMSDDSEMRYLQESEFMEFNDSLVLDRMDLN